MAKTDTDWTEGRGLLSNGFPDPDWSNRIILRAYPTEEGWVAWVVWGTTWAHSACAKGPTFNHALEQAGYNAKRDGCPDEWNPCLPNPLNWDLEKDD